MGGRGTKTHSCQSSDETVRDRNIDVIVECMQDISLHSEQLLVRVSVITQVQEIIH